MNPKNWVEWLKPLIIWRSPRYWSMSFKTIPTPSTTACNGLSATATGRPHSSLRSLSKHLIIAPPPQSTIPRSIMSADNSGGVCSKVAFTAATICRTLSLSASLISMLVTVTDLGTPVRRSRPFTEISTLIQRVG